MTHLWASTPQTAWQLNLTQSAKAPVAFLPIARSSHLSLMSTSTDLFDPQTTIYQMPHNREDTDSWTLCRWRTTILQQVPLILQINEIPSPKASVRRSSVLGRVNVGFRMCKFILQNWSSSLNVDKVLPSGVAVNLQLLHLFRFNHVTVSKAACVKSWRSIEVKDLLFYLNWRTEVILVNYPFTVQVKQYQEWRSCNCWWSKTHGGMHHSKCRSLT